MGMWEENRSKPAPPDPGQEMTEEKLGEIAEALKEDATATDVVCRLVTLVELLVMQMSSTTSRLFNHFMEDKVANYTKVPAEDLLKWKLKDLAQIADAQVEPAITSRCAEVLEACARRHKIPLSKYVTYAELAEAIQEARRN